MSIYSNAVPCDKCTHRKICKFKEQFIDVQKAVDELNCHFSDGSTVRLSDICWIEGLELKCVHFEIAGSYV